LFLRVLRHNLTWDSRGLCTTLVLISVSIKNVRTIALALYSNGCGLQFLTPADEAFSSLWPAGRSHSSYMVALVIKDGLELFDEDLIEPDIEGESEAWARRDRRLARRFGMVAGP